jgi:hypothetical protein
MHPYVRYEETAEQKSCHDNTPFLEFREESHGQAHYLMAYWAVPEQLTV